MNEQKLFNVSESDQKKLQGIFDEIIGLPAHSLLWLLAKFKEVGIEPGVAAAAPAEASEAAPKEEKASVFKLKIKSVGDKVKSIPVLKGILGQNVQISVLAGFLKDDKVIDDKTFSEQEAKELIEKFAQVNTVVEMIKA
jgi:hypothetical protein